MHIILIGVNHRTAPIELRERVAFSVENARRAAQQLRASGVVGEVVVVSTCNRSELYGVFGRDAEGAAAALDDFITAFHGLPAGSLNGALYHHHDHDAVRHLFRVASGLDSMLLGEAEILGQVRQAYMVAFENGDTGPVLNRLFQGALEIGKRVRTETEIGTRPMSAAFAAVKLAEQIFGKLRNHKGLILGAGAMGEQLVEHLRDRGMTSIYVANRSRERGEELARRVSGEAFSWEDLPRALELPDIVVASVGGNDPVLTRSMLERAMGARGNRALFVIDLGVPRNVEPAVADLYNVFLYSMDDLTEIVEQNKHARAKEVPRAEALISEQLEKFKVWQASARSVALLAELREKLQHNREEFLRQHMDEMEHLAPEDRERVARLTAELLDNILEQPASRLRSEKELRRKLEEIEAVRHLFGLEENKP
ncbi:MAG: glutamyl-tRNA reductase [Acidobacteria bacterium]|nr:glutamyl-tRNA reductase [Acidobacteriota bacterium]MCL5286598.1 glutamyl-tRNA reductase [Acidobacteriota bacterium]